MSMENDMKDKLGGKQNRPDGFLCTLRRDEDGTQPFDLSKELKATFRALERCRLV